MVFGGVLFVYGGAIFLGEAGPLRLAGVIAATVGAGLLLAGLAAHRQRNRGWRPYLAALLTALALIGVSASATVFFLAVYRNQGSVEFTRRYGVQVEADFGGQDCWWITRSRGTDIHTRCDATWVIGDETRRGSLVFTDDAYDAYDGDDAFNDNETRLAHVLDDRSDTAYTAPPPGTPQPRDASLALGRLPAWPVLPALLVHAFAWVLLLVSQPTPIAPSARPPQQSSSREEDPLSQDEPRPPA